MDLLRLVLARLPLEWFYPAQLGHALIETRQRAVNRILEPTVVDYYTECALQGEINPYRMLHGKYTWDRAVFLDQYIPDIVGWQIDLDVALHYARPEMQIRICRSVGPYNFKVLDPERIKWTAETRKYLLEDLRANTEENAFLIGYLAYPDSIPSSEDFLHGILQGYVRAAVGSRNGWISDPKLETAVLDYLRRYNLDPVIVEDDLIAQGYFSLINNPRLPAVDPMNAEDLTEAGLGTIEPDLLRTPISTEVLPNRWITISVSLIERARRMLTLPFSFSPKYRTILRIIVGETLSDVDLHLAEQYPQIGLYLMHVAHPQLTSEIVQSSYVHYRDSGIRCLIFYDLIHYFRIVEPSVSDDHKLHELAARGQGWSCPRVWKWLLE